MSDITGPAVLAELAELYGEVDISSMKRRSFADGAADREVVHRVTVVAGGRQMTGEAPTVLAAMGHALDLWEGHL